MTLPRAGGSFTGRVLPDVSHPGLRHSLFSSLLYLSRKMLLYSFVYPTPTHEKTLSLYYIVKVFVNRVGKSVWIISVGFLLLMHLCIPSYNVTG